MDTIEDPAKTFHYQALWHTEIVMGLRLDLRLGSLCSAAVLFSPLVISQFSTECLNPCFSFPMSISSYDRSTS